MTARKSAAPARLPITLPTTFVVARGGVESWVPSVPASPARVVAAGAGTTFVFAGPSPPPPADVAADGSNDEVMVVCVDAWVDETCDEDAPDDVDANDEELFRVEDRVADNCVPEDVR
jgi:hypothetical protein